MSDHFNNDKSTEYFGANFTVERTRIKYVNHLRLIASLILKRENMRIVVLKETMTQSMVVRNDLMKIIGSFPKWYVPELKINNKRHVEFDNGNRVVFSCNADNLKGMSIDIILTDRDIENDYNPYITSNGGSVLYFEDEV